jgi:hypothetical protein
LGSKVKDHKSYCVLTIKMVSQMKKNIWCLQVSLNCFYWYHKFIVNNNKFTCKYNLEWKNYREVRFWCYIIHCSKPHSCFLDNGQQIKEPKVVIEEKSCILKFTTTINQVKYR